MKEPNILLWFYLFIDCAPNHSMTVSKKVEILFNTQKKTLNRHIDYDNSLQKHIENAHKQRYNIMGIIHFIHSQHANSAAFKLKLSYSFITPAVLTTDLALYAL